MGQIVPKGTEASVFALVTSLQVVGGTAGGAISAVLTEALGVTLRDYSRLADLVIITSVWKLSALPFVVLVPARIDVHGGHIVHIAAVTAIAGTRAVFPHPTSIFIALAYLGPPDARIVRVNAGGAGRGRGSTQQRRCGTQQPPDRAMGAADEPVHDY